MPTRLLETSRSAEFITVHGAKVPSMTSSSGKSGQTTELSAGSRLVALTTPALMALELARSMSLLTTLLVFSVAPTSLESMLSPVIRSFSTTLRSSAGVRSQRLWPNSLTTRTSSSFGRIPPTLPGLTQSIVASMVSLRNYSTGLSGATQAKSSVDGL
jgi:hypothetical protein